MFSDRNDNDKFYPGKRFETPRTDRQYESFYDMSSQEIQDFISRNPSLFTVRTLNLGVAQDTPLEIKYPGQALVIFGHDGSAARTVNTTAFVAVQFNQWNANLVDNLNQTAAGGPLRPFGFPMKHARGFRGPFNSIFVTWPQQLSGGLNVYADLVIFANKDMPWIDGESCT